MTNVRLLLVALLYSVYMCNGFTLKTPWKRHIASYRTSVIRAQKRVEENHGEDGQGLKDVSFEVEGAKKKSNDGVGGYDPGEVLRSEELNVGDPQIKVIEKERSVTSILKELAAIQQQGPQKYCILGTRHCTYLHQQIIELL